MSDNREDEQRRRGRRRHLRRTIQLTSSSEDASYGSADEGGDVQAEPLVETEEGQQGVPENPREGEHHNSSSAWSSRTGIELVSARSAEIRQAVRQILRSWEDNDAGRMSNGAEGRGEERSELVRNWSIRHIRTVRQVMQTWREDEAAIRGLTSEGGHRSTTDEGRIDRSSILGDHNLRMIGDPEWCSQLEMSDDRMQRSSSSNVQNRNVIGRSLRTMSTEEPEGEIVEEKFEEKWVRDDQRVHMWRVKLGKELVDLDRKSVV